MPRPESRPASQAQCSFLRDLLHSAGHELPHASRAATTETIGAVAAIRRGGTRAPSRKRLGTGAGLAYSGVEIPTPIGVPSSHGSLASRRSALTESLSSASAELVRGMQTCSRAGRTSGPCITRRTAPRAKHLAVGDGRGTRGGDHHRRGPRRHARVRHADHAVRLSIRRLRRHRPLGSTPHEGRARQPCRPAAEARDPPRG